MGAHATSTGAAMVWGLTRSPAAPRTREPRKDFVERDHLARAIERITCDRFEHARELGAAQKRHQLAQRGLIERFSPACEHVALLCDGNEIELELPRRGLDREAGVGHAARDERRHRGMGELAAVVALNPR